MATVLTYPGIAVWRRREDGRGTPYSVAKTTDVAGQVLGVWVTATEGRHGGPYFLLPVDGINFCHCRAWDFQIVESDEIGVQWCHHQVLLHEAQQLESRLPVPPVGERLITTRSPRLLHAVTALAQQTMTDFEPF